MTAHSPPAEETLHILSIDPGRDKCGVAVVDNTGTVIMHRIYPRAQMEDMLRTLAREYAIGKVVLGHATTSREVRQEIRQWLPHLEVLTIDETGSTLEARALYWQAEPPRGWRRLIPLSLQAPPRPIDDFAAVVLARRYLSQATGSPACQGPAPQVEGEPS